MNYSRFVRCVKYILAITAFLLPSIIVVDMTFSYLKRNRGLLPSEKGDDTPALLQLRLIDKSSGGDDYLLSAKRLYIHTKTKTPSVDIVKEIKDLDIQLPTLTVRLANQNENWVFIRSPKGLYENEKQELQLSSGVDIFTNHGYEGHTQVMLVELKEGKLYSQTPFHLHGPGGTLVSDKMQASQREGWVKFLFHVQGTVYPHLYKHTSASSPQKQQGLVEGGATNKPVAFSSHQLTLNKEKESIILEGNVRLKQEEQKLFCDELLIQLEQGQVKFVKAVGSVKVELKDARQAFAKTGTYNPKENTLTLLEDVKLTSGADKILGQKLVVDLTTGEALLSSGKRQKIRGRLSKQ